METTKEATEITLPEANAPEHTCKSCGHSFSGNYCNICGEKVLVVHDRTFRSFISGVFSFADNKFFKTLLLIVWKPGFLSKEYAEGRRVNYQRPLQLFFVLNLVYFLFPVLQLFNTSLRTQMYLRTHSALVRDMVFGEVGRDALVLEGYSLMYNQKSTGLAKLLIIVFVVLASLPMMVIYRKRNRYFTDHVTLAVELTSYNLIINAILLNLVLIVINQLLLWTGSGWQRFLDDFTLTIIFVLTNGYFLFRAGRTFYGQKGKVLIIKVLIGLLGLFLALEAFRLVLFLVTYWSL